MEKKLAARSVQITNSYIAKMEDAKRQLALYLSGLRDGFEIDDTWKFDAQRMAFTKDDATAQGGTDAPGK